MTLLRYGAMVVETCVRGDLHELGGGVVYLFSRAREAYTADLPAAIGAAVEGGQRATEVSGLQVDTWMTFMSAEANVFSWTTIVPSLADLEAGFGKLLADAAYNEWFASADELFVGPMTDRLFRIVSPMPEDAAPAAFVTVVEGNASAGHLGDAMAHGMRIAETAGRVGGGNTVLCAGVTGGYGSIAFITGADSIEELQRMNEAVTGSTEFLHLVDAGGAYYAPGATATIHRRLA